MVAATSDEEIAIIKQEFEELKKLDPEERIKRLEEMEHRQREALKQAAALIEESKNEIAIEEKLKAGRRMEIPSKIVFPWE